MRIIGILDILYNEQFLSISNFAVKAGTATRTVEKDITFLRKQGLIEFQGARKTGEYVLTEKGRVIIESQTEGNNDES